MFNTLQKHKTMKRLLTIGLMLVSAFALTNCAEEIAAPVQDDITVDGNIENITPPEEEVNIPFEVFATVGGEVETKTQNIGNSTYWVANDGISVFHKTGDKITHNKEFTISSENLASGLFEGGLSSVLGETNDWFFLYPYKEFKAPTTTEAGDYSSSGSTLTVKGVQIGKAEWTGVVPGNKSHIAGEASPMYGLKSGLSKNVSPDIKMKHLAAVVGIKVVNETNGEIIISDIEFGVPDVVNKEPITQKKTIVQTQIPIIGDCDITYAEKPTVAISTGDGVKTYCTTKVTMNNIISLDPKGTNADNEDNSVIVYLPVRPFSTKNVTVTIKVNGSVRTVKLDSDKLASGKVTTFRVPVNDFIKDFTEDLSSNAFNITSEGEQGYEWKETKHESGSLFNKKYWYEYTQGNPDNTHAACTAAVLNVYKEHHDYVINGQSCAKVYELGTKSSAGTLTLTGWAEDILNALPLNFYISGIDNNPTAMTIQSINLWIPEYNVRKGEHGALSSPSETIEYHNLKTRYRLDQAPSLGELLDLAGYVIEGLSVTENGLDRNSLIAFVDPNTITFNGIPNNGYFYNKKVVVLNEDATNKSITPSLLDTFLKNKLSTADYSASFLGLVAIVNATKSSVDGSLSYNDYYYEAERRTYTDLEMKNLAETTANAIYNKVLNVFKSKLAAIDSTPLVNKLTSAEKLSKNLLGLVFSSPTDLIHKMRDMKFQVVIKTYPYAETYTTTDLTTGFQPVMLWEVHASNQE